MGENMTQEELKKLFKSTRYIKDVKAKTFYIFGYVNDEAYVKIQKYNYSEHGDTPIFTEEPIFMPRYMFRAAIKCGHITVNSRRLKNI